MIEDPNQNPYNILAVELEDSGKAFTLTVHDYKYVDKFSAIDPNFFPDLESTYNAALEKTADDLLADGALVNYINDALAEAKIFNVPYFKSLFMSHNYKSKGKDVVDTLNYKVVDPTGAKIETLYYPMTSWLYEGAYELIEKPINDASGTVFSVSSFDASNAAQVYLSHHWVSAVTSNNI